MIRRDDMAPTLQLASGRSVDAWRGSNQVADRLAAMGEQTAGAGPAAADAGAGQVDEGALVELARLRASIDNLDAALVHVLAERFRCTQAVGLLKAEQHMPPADPAREAQQIARLRRLAQEARLDPEFAEKFLNFIIAEVVRHHEAIANR